MANGCTVILEYSITPILVDNVYYPPVVLVYMQKTISGAMGRQKLMWGPRAPSHINPVGLAGRPPRPTTNPSFLAEPFGQ